MMNGAGPLSHIPRLLRGVRRPLRQYQTQRELQQQLVFARELVPELIRRGVLPETTGLRIGEAILTRSAVVVAKLGHEQRDDLALLKLPISPEAEASCARHHEVVTQLHQMPELQHFAALVPRPMAVDNVRGRQWYVESVLAGRSARERLETTADLAPMLLGAAGAIGALHAASARTQVVDAARFDRLVGEHLAVLKQLAAAWPETTSRLRQLDALHGLLERHLMGRSVSIGWVHGDFWLGNILVDGSEAKPSGIVDWDRAVPDELPLHDVLHLVLYSRKLQRGTELGEEVVRSLAPETDPDHGLIAGLLERQGLPTEREFVRAAVVLYWLRFVAVNLARYPRFRRDMRWLKPNLFLVMQQDLS